jgi:hypothetical protein
MWVLRVGAHYTRMFIFITGFCALWLFMKLAETIPFRILSPGTWGCSSTFLRKVQPPSSGPKSNTRKQQPMERIARWKPGSGVSLSCHNFCGVWLYTGFWIDVLIYWTLWYTALLHFTVHYYTDTNVHSFVFTSRCLVAAFNGGRSLSSGFQNCPRPQLPHSNNNNS